MSKICFTRYLPGLTLIADPKAPITYVSGRWTVLLETSKSQHAVVVSSICVTNVCSSTRLLATLQSLVFTIVDCCEIKLITYKLIMRSCVVSTVTGHVITTRCRIGRNINRDTSRLHTRTYSWRYADVWRISEYLHECANLHANYACVEWRRELTIHVDVRMSSRSQKAKWKLSGVETRATKWTERGKLIGVAHWHSEQRVCQ